MESVNLNGITIMRHSINKIVGYGPADWMPNGIEKVIYFEQLTFFCTSFSQSENLTEREREPKTNFITILDVMDGSAT